MTDSGHDERLQKALNRKWPDCVCPGGPDSPSAYLAKCPRHSATARVFHDLVASRRKLDEARFDASVARGERDTAMRDAIIDALFTLIPVLIGVAVIIAAGSALGVAGFVVACLVVAIILGTMK